MAKRELSVSEKKTIKSMFIRSHLTFISFNMTKMEANGFTISMAPAIESIYGDDKEAKEQAYIRHQNFFNTHAVAFSLIVGLAYALEREHKENNLPIETIESVKASLMGPTAGVFDSIFFNCLRVIAAGIAIGLMSAGNPLGIPIFIFFYGICQSIMKYYMLKYGYIYGTNFIEAVFNSGLIGSLTKAASSLGLIMVGAMTATSINVPVNCTISLNGAEVVLADVLNSIFPGFLSIVLLFAVMKLIRKGIRPIYIIFGIFGMSLLLALLGIF
ncbi:MAG: PTS system mannose/fructose/sorbose family transporter subunit IID [Lachnospiraceae bacterium]|nr:PTS system mannose/fructose/sorbose family transporter subunit IID [Lachnospiraceae bacterium]